MGQEPNLPEGENERRQPDSGAETVPSSSPTAVEPHRQTVSPARAAWILSGIFFTLLTVNLCFPTPQGPGDTGDMFRNFVSFSTGPKGLSYWPSEKQEADQRFWHFYHRFWRLEVGEQASLANPSTSRLLYWPARLLRLNSPPGYYDLNLNTFYLIFILAIALHLVIRSRPPRMSLLCAALAILILTDSGPSSYLNSFFQESGGYFFTVLLVIALLGIERRFDLTPTVVAVVAAIGVMGSKRPFGPSVAIVLLVLLCIGLPRKSFWKRAMLTSVIALLIALCTVVVANRTNVERHAKVYAYNSIFNRILPAIPDNQKANYLRQADLSPDLVRLNNTTVFSPDHDPQVAETFDGFTHLRAVAALRFHPQTAIHLFDEVMRHTGVYAVPFFGYREIAFGDRQFLGSIKWWTTVRNRYLGGRIAYIVGLLICASLWFLRREGEAGDRLRFYRWMALAFFLGSLLQILIVTLGDGPRRPWKQLYLANLFWDVHFIAALAAFDSYLTPWTARWRLRLWPSRPGLSPGKDGS